jgi:flagellar biosynthesis protein FliQ
MNPTDRITVTLDAQTWETVLRVIAQAPVPYTIVAPLIASIQQQCTRQQVTEQSLALVPRDNEAGE